MGTNTNRQKTDHALMSDMRDVRRTETAEEKLSWLEEAGEFVQAFVSPEKIQRWRQYQQKENPESKYVLNSEEIPNPNTTKSRTNPKH